MQAGDDVVTTPFSFVASANCLLYEGARPVFCDIDPRTLNISPQAAADAVTEQTTGLLPVHIFGYPADMPALERLAADLSLWIVEDACEAIGAVHADGSQVGARGNFSVFGFYPNKQITTGEGGAVVSPSAAHKERVDSERNQGRAPDMGWLDHDRLGFNYRLDDLSCALGIAQLERLGELLAARAGVAGLYNEALGSVEGLGLPCPDEGGDRRGWFVYVVQLPPGVDRDEAVVAMRERGVDTKPYLPGDPPAELLPRALRPQGGRVPGVRGRGGPLAGAPVLPRAERRRGGAGGGRAPRGHRSTGLTSATKPGSERDAAR